jgi:peptidoglycan-associated lipoprotein
MKSITYLTLAAVGLALVLGTAGCAGKRKPIVTDLGPGGGKSGTSTVGGGNENPLPPVSPPGSPESTNLAELRKDLPDPAGLEGMTPDREAFKAYAVYFDFDRAAIRTGEQSKLESVAKVLKGQNNTKVQIEGHCDERGTEEYNRSLGERRALAAREYLLRLGLESSRVYTITYGEDKPANPAHNEEAWGKNRRDEFILYLPKGTAGGKRD